MPHTSQEEIDTTVPDQTVQTHKRTPGTLMHGQALHVVPRGPRAHAGVDHVEKIGGLVNGKSDAACFGVVTFPLGTLSCIQLVQRLVCRLGNLACERGLHLHLWRPSRVVNLPGAPLPKP